MDRFPQTDPVGYDDDLNLYAHNGPSPDRVAPCEAGEWQWRATNNDDEHYVYAIAL